MYLVIKIIVKFFLSLGLLFPGSMCLWNTFIDAEREVEHAPHPLIGA